MCEYCAPNVNTRNSYEMHSYKYGATDASIKISIDDCDEGLMIECDHAYYNSQDIIEHLGMKAKAIIRYCPWCGRKLESFSEKTKNWTEEQIKTYLGMTINKGEIKE